MTANLELPDDAQLEERLAELRAALANNTGSNPFLHCWDIIERIAQETGSWFDCESWAEAADIGGSPEPWPYPFKVMACEVDDGNVLDDVFVNLHIHAPDGELIGGYSGDLPFTFLGDATSLDDKGDDKWGIGAELLHAAQVACDRWLAVLEASAASNDRSMTEPAESATEWRFVRSGDGYDIAGPGEKGHFRKSKGLEYVERLLHRSGKPIPMSELIGAVGNTRAWRNGTAIGDADCDEEEWYERSGWSKQPTIDEMTKEQYRDRLREIQEGLSEAEQNNDPVLISQYKKEQKELADELEKATGLGRRDKDLNSQIDRWRSSIKKALNRAYEAMRDATPPLTKLAGHLENSVVARGDSYLYDPSPVPPWSLG